jgi:hypothetical protein
MAILPWVAQAKSAVKRFAVQALDGAPPERDAQVSDGGPAGNGARAAPTRTGRGSRRPRFRDTLETTDAGRTKPDGGGRLFSDRGGPHHGNPPGIGALHLVLVISVIAVAVGLALAALTFGIKVLIH